MPDTGLHMTAALSSAWLPWVYLAMVILVWLCCVLQPRYLRGLINNGFATLSTNVVEQVPSIGSQVAQWLFNCIVPAIGLFVMTEQEVVEGDGRMMLMIGLSLLIDGVRLTAALLVRYTFRLGRVMNQAYMRYYSLRSMFTFLLFIILLLVIYTSPHSLWLTILGIASVVYMVTLGLQWGRLFCNSLIDVAGLLVYMVTIELLPAAILLEAGRQLYFIQIV